MSNIRALDPTAQLTFVPKADTTLAEKEQLKIFYRVLSMKEEAEISDAQIRSMQKGKRSEYSFLISTADIKRMELSIKGWENFFYPDNHPTKKGGAVPFAIDNIGLIPQEVRREFVSKLTGRDEEGDDAGEAKTE
jgi:hypothetical protein